MSFNLQVELLKYKNVEYTSGSSTTTLIYAVISIYFEHQQRIEEHLKMVKDLIKIHHWGLISRLAMQFHSLRKKLDIFYFTPKTVTLNVCMYLCKDQMQQGYYQQDILYTSLVLLK